MTFDEIQVGKYYWVRFGITMIERAIVLAKHSENQIAVENTVSFYGREFKSVDQFLGEAPAPAPRKSWWRRFIP